MIPKIIVDTNQSYKTYEISDFRKDFLGKGEFAKVYKLKDMSTGEVVAGKIVAKQKSDKTKKRQRDKIAQEISLHRTLSNQYIVKLFSFFQDQHFVYLILELCRHRSLMELHKSRKAITEPETRYYMNQILIGVKYLHDNKIVHRDLKLGNIFLNDNMEIKLGGFGLATQVDYEGERKQSLRGNPYFIAPEVLQKKGHSYEVDIWSLGCILYTLLVGNAPFKTSSLKDTHNRIKNNEYHIPPIVSPLAKRLIFKLLQSDPTKRPTIDEMLCDDFMTGGYMPTQLSVSCLTMVPRFDSEPNQSLIARSPGHLMEINEDIIAPEDPNTSGIMEDENGEGGGNATPGPSPTGPVPANGSGSPELTLEPEPPQDEPNNNVAASGSDSDISELTVDTVVALVHQDQPNEDEPTEP